MITSALILGFSVALFVYWFRYSCLLIMRSKSERNFASQIATANFLSFPEVQERLQQESWNQELDGLERALARDYRILSYLLRHAASFKVAGYTVEERMLALNFRLMRIWYSLTRHVAQPAARRALEEMSVIVGYMAETMGERAAAASRA